MITKEWLEGEIKLLDELKIPAAMRVVEAERMFRQANSELIAAKEELNALRACITELIWQLANYKETGGKQ